jgi:von Willebrand factor type A domain-containing protein
MQMAMAVLMAFLAAPRVTPAPAKPVAAAPRPRVEVAFVLDTTGSMGGLIEGAKRRIWSIARHIGEGRPRPDLRIALVAYRDKGDAYVTEVHPFTADMDAVYQSLSSLRAEGGGDGPEHVSAALHDAVDTLPWSDAGALRIIFLVGDAPPHVDYQDGFDYRRHVADATRRGIVVDAIQCGGDAQTAAVWREIASTGRGHYAQIDGSGGMNAQVTPYDAELAQLGAALSETVVLSGDAPQRAAGAKTMQAREAMPAAVAVEAAGYLARADRLAEQDLVDRPLAEQRAELKANRAPALAGKTEAQALDQLAAKKARRAELRAKIETLQKKRDATLAAGQSDAFDTEVVAQLKEKGATVGIKY